LGELDDVRIVLGGFGEPAMHPQLGEIVRILRGGGAAAIAVRTSALVGEDVFDDLIFELPVDVVIVTLDAATRQTYQYVHGVDAFDRVTQRVQGWLQRRRERRQVRPMIVPEFCKTLDNFADMEAFFDDWMRRTGTAVISGPSHYARQCADRAVTRVAPPRRVPCRQVFNRATVLADGTLAGCDRDFAGRQAAGSLRNTAFRELWSGRFMSGLRDAHRAGSLAALPLCPNCDDWHRP
jgi:hypothetical protein